MLLQQGKKYTCIKQPSENFSVGKDYIAITTYQILDNYACPIDIRGWGITNFFELKDEGIKYNIKEPKFKIGDVARLAYQKDGKVIYKITEPLKIMFSTLRNETWYYAIKGLESGMCYEFVSEDLLVPELEKSVDDKITLTNEKVNHPNHYNQGGIECLDVIKAYYGDDGYEGFCAGNVLKYVMRYKHKENALEDLKKARFYLDEVIKLNENNE